MEPGKNPSSAIGNLPGVEVNVDPAKILTAPFDGGREIWTAEVV